MTTNDNGPEGEHSARRAFDEVEVLYEGDGPLITVLSDGQDLWLANCRSFDATGMFYMATKVVQEEIDAIRAGRISVRAAHADRPWVAVDNLGDGYVLGIGKGDLWSERMLPASGAGIEPWMRDLPDVPEGRDGAEP